MKAIGEANFESSAIAIVFMVLVAAATVFLTWCFVSMAREVHEAKLWRKRRKDLPKSVPTDVGKLVMARRPAVASTLLDRHNDRHRRLAA